MIISTVAIVVKNGGPFIASTLQSVISQKNVSMELVVIDGGSTDDTLNEVARFGSKVDQVISGPDDGVYFGMNKALSVARGEYMIYMNCGDGFSTENVMSTAIGSAESSRSDFLIGRYRRVAGMISRIIDPLDPASRLALIAKGQLRRATKRLPCHQATLNRVSALRKLNGYDTSYSVLADQELLLRAASAGMRVATSSLVFCDYQVGGLSSQERASSSEMERILLGHGCRADLVRKALRPNWRTLLRRAIEGVGRPRGARSG